jgi:hypothetical protein
LHGEIIDIFQAAGLKQPDISILSDQFLSEVRGLKHKNVAAEVLAKLPCGRRLIADFAWRLAPAFIRKPPAATSAAIQRQNLATARQQVFSHDVMHRRDEIQISFCGCSFILRLHCAITRGGLRMDLHD